jgi:hypothetical protein
MFTLPMFYYHSLALFLSYIYSDTALSCTASYLFDVDASWLQRPSPPLLNRHIPLWGRGPGSSQRGLETDVEQRAGSYRPAVYRNWASDGVQSSRDRLVLAVETWGSVHASAESMPAARANRSQSQQ